MINKKFQYQNQNPALRVSSHVIIGIVISVALAALFACFLWFTPMSVRSLTKNDVNIANAKALVRELRNNSAMGQSFGKEKRYTLTQNIQLSQEDINSLAGLSFYGELNGNGHSVSFDNGTYIDHPLISHLKKDALIQKVQFNNPVILAAHGSETALIGINDGTISNVCIRGCTLDARQLKVGDNRTCSVAALAVTNTENGQIEFFTADVKVVIPEFAKRAEGGQSAEEISKSWMCAMGSVAVQDFRGKIQNVVLDVSYPADFAALNPIDGPMMGYMRHDIGYIIGRYDNSASGLSAITVLRSQPLLLAHDIYELGDGGSPLSIMDYENFEAEYNAKYLAWKNEGCWQLSKLDDRVLPILMAAEENV